MNQEINPYLDVVVANSNNRILKLSLKLRSKSSEDQRKAFGGSPLAGYFYLFRDHEVPDMVYECVPSRELEDAISSLYVNHRIFNSVGTLVAAREHLIKAIAEKVGLSPEAVGIDDPGRGRVLPLKDLSTGQLIDLLAEKMGKTIMTTDSHVVSSAAQ